MPLYEMNCECGHGEDVFASFSEGPPSGVECSECGEEMYQNFGASAGFILKGQGWAGKEISSRGDVGRLEEQADEILHQDKRKQEEVQEVTDIRRQGTAARKDLQKKNPEKWNRYVEATKEGYKAKPPKSEGGAE